MCIRDRVLERYGRGNFIENMPLLFAMYYYTAVLVMQIPEAVSYTHLDVYKRQDFQVRLLGDEDYTSYCKGIVAKPTSLIESGEFTFENFVVGKSNQLAHAAARAVADAPAESYNPLLIYGDSGLGKTHLIYAIAHSIRQHNPGAKIVYKMCIRDRIYT